MAAPSQLVTFPRRRLRAVLALLTLAVSLTGISSVMANGGADAASYVQAFAGRPASPQAWNRASWDVTVHSRDTGTWDALQPMHAMHGMDCSAAPAAHAHSSYQDAVFVCNDHLMTAINATGYGVVYLTPNQMVDLTTGEAVIRFDVSTLRTSSRDWISLWLTPYEDHLQLPLDRWLPDLHGEPRNAIHLRLDWSEGQSSFRASVVNDHVLHDLPSRYWEGWEKVLEPSPVRRDTVEVRVSQTHLKVGMPDYGLWWVDTALPEALDWTQAVAQFGHHSYNPTKDCSLSTPCSPNTWHWDNVSISPAVPFLILPGDRRVVDARQPEAVTFASPAPAGSHVRFAAIGKEVELSVDGGATWQPAHLQTATPGVHANQPELFQSYWTPVPQGTRSVQIRADDWASDGPWHVRDISIWSRNAVDTSDTLLAATDPHAGHAGHTASTAAE